MNINWKYKNLFIAFCPAGYKTFRNYETNWIYYCNVTLNLATVDLIYNLQVAQFNATEAEKERRRQKAFLNAKNKLHVFMQYNALNCSELPLL